MVASHKVKLMIFRAVKDNLREALKRLKERSRESSILKLLLK